MKMKTLIIDTSYLIYRSYFAYPKLTHNDQPVGAFFGFAKTIIELVRENKPDQLVFAGDTAEPTWRHKLVDDYKAGRAQIEEAMVSQFPLINNWCSKITKNVFKFPGWEADDIIFSITLDELTQFRTICKVDMQPKVETLENLFDEIDNQAIPDFPIRFDELVKKSKDSANEILIYSSDRDLYQMLSLPNLKFIHSNKGNNDYFGINEFKAKYQLHPLQWLDYKALVGDPGDNLKGVEGVGPKITTSILQQTGCLYSLFEKLDLEKKPFFRTAGGCWATDNDIHSFIQNPKNAKIVEKLKQNYEVIKHTYLMSSLQCVPEVNFKSSGFILSDGLGELEKHGFKSLLTMIKKLEPQNVEQEGLF
jgi:DNA polymerase I